MKTMVTIEKHQYTSNPGWERIDGDKNNSTARLKVVGGWLVRNTMVYTSDHHQTGALASSMSFVPDPDYRWDVEWVELR